MSVPEQIPPLKSLLKSSEVEDPINVHIHRPAAYGFVWAIWRTKLTPNMVTLLAVLTGIAAGAMFLWGTRGAMVAGGLLVWTAAILDGADGILARAKNMQSQFGRAIDGWADMIVAVATVVPAGYHIWTQHHEVLHLWMMVPAVVMTTVHLSLYDYYKETYLRLTRPGGGEGEDYEDVANRVDEARTKGLISYIAIKHVMLPYLRQQQRLIRWFDPHSNELRARAKSNPDFAGVYRKHNLAPMRLLTATSLAPHSYLMAWCAMADQLVVYLWIRLVAMNLIFVVAIIWQRWATRQMLKQIDGIDGNFEYSRELVHCEQEL
ncbi:MAG: CDP-alcohol phosphatidyltransferase family protein [Polyangiales bacterium]